jgi:hypothetical protein
LYFDVFENQCVYNGPDLHHERVLGLANEMMHYVAQNYTDETKLSEQAIIKHVDAQLDNHLPETLPATPREQRVIKYPYNDEIYFPPRRFSSERALDIITASLYVLRRHYGDDARITDNIAETLDKMAKHNIKQERRPDGYISIRTKSAEALESIYKALQTATNPNRSDAKHIKSVVPKGFHKRETPVLNEKSFARIVNALKIAPASGQEEKPRTYESGKQPDGQPFIRRKPECIDNIANVELHELIKFARTRKGIIALKAFEKQLKTRVSLTTNEDGLALSVLKPEFRSPEDPERHNDPAKTRRFQQAVNAALVNCNLHLQTTGKLEQNIAIDICRKSLRGDLTARSGLDDLFDQLGSDKHYIEQQDIQNLLLGEQQSRKEEFRRFLKSLSDNRVQKRQREVKNLHSDSMGFTIRIANISGNGKATQNHKKPYAEITIESGDTHNADRMMSVALAFMNWLYERFYRTTDGASLAKNYKSEAKSFINYVNDHYSEQSFGDMLRSCKLHVPTRSTYTLDAHQFAYRSSSYTSLTQCANAGFITPQSASQHKSGAGVAPGTRNIPAIVYQLVQLQAVSGLYGRIEARTEYYPKPDSQQPLGRRIRDFNKTGATLELNLN